MELFHISKRYSPFKKIESCFISGKQDGPRTGISLNQLLGFESAVIDGSLKNVLCFALKQTDRNSENSTSYFLTCFHFFSNFQKKIYESFIAEVFHETNGTETLTSEKSVFDVRSYAIPCLLQLFFDVIVHHL